MAMWKWGLAWIPMLLIAIANGVLRQGWYEKYVEELRAHQISTLSGVLFFGIYIWFVIRRWRPDSSVQALSIGLFWLSLTVAFEFFFMHYVGGIPWSRLLYDYNIFAGRVWVIILVWVTIAPYVFYRLQK